MEKIKWFYWSIWFAHIQQYNKKLCQKLNQSCMLWFIMHFLLQNVNLAAVYVVFLIVFMSVFFLNVLNVAKNESLRPTLNQPERANSSWSKLVFSTQSCSLVLTAAPNRSPSANEIPESLGELCWLAVCWVAVGLGLTGLAVLAVVLLLIGQGLFTAPLLFVVMAAFTLPELVELIGACGQDWGVKENTLSGVDGDGDGSKESRKGRGRRDGNPWIRRALVNGHSSGRGSGKENAGPECSLSSPTQGKAEEGGAGVSGGARTCEPIIGCARELVLSPCARRGLERGTSGGMQWMGVWGQL